MEAFLRRYSCWEALKNAFWIELSQAELLNEPLNGTIGKDAHGEFRVVIASERVSSEDRVAPDLAASGFLDEDDAAASTGRDSGHQSKSNSKKLWKLFQRVSA